ncbi:MAG: hypothetical protein COV07_03610 [Candidatus Vogelbacteria bacterium CG10_big_fil_rev_8_21_14_0_10_45_14]|uniref:Uncharacterized protein n=1 Tax=Candidatus Vogelbacteria bacterium CG10_big_fil_rev_8_21_14_0_10_45_14 TaxID=1975042 RepID=A0A2H0RLA1_9BACT|nr:MAG: hypothetical protein COV07_03610 [Candidatus Vogelbacteria bacterium CG10_big_fil_rev_8_21_14_0_10_45_14]
MNTYALKQELEKHLGIDELTEAGRAEIVEGLTENMILAIMAEVLPRIPEDARPEFEKLQSEGDTEGVLAFYAKHVPDFQTIMQETASQVVLEYRALLAQ